MPLGPGGVFAPVNDPSRKIVWVEERHAIPWDEARPTRGKRSTKTGKYLSADVMRKSDALDLERSAFTWRDPKRIAASLKHSAERSARRKARPFRSAIVHADLYINRASRNLSHRVRKSWFSPRTSCDAFSAEASGRAASTTRPSSARRPGPRPPAASSERTDAGKRRRSAAPTSTSLGGATVEPLR
jgi:hypothetical protein